MSFEYNIETQEIIPPVGQYRFFAIPIILKSGVGKIKVDLGDVFGKTEQEAKDKMEIKIKEWIENNQ